jgi:tetratricopeptide (TPR) repeat protein
MRAAAAAGLARPEIVPPIDAHRRHRGPYTMVGTLLRAIVADMLRQSVDLVARHDIEVLSTTPELRGVVPSSRETLTSLAVPEERTRFYSRLRTRRIAHGLTELLRDYLLDGGPTGSVLVVDRVEEADPTDVEVLVVLLRRLDPALLTLVICTGHGPLDADLTAALGAYAERRLADPVDWPPAAGQAAAYVESDCTSDDPRLSAAYANAAESVRRELHDARAARLIELADSGEQSLRLGAIPYHLEHGSDPAGAGAKSLLAALNTCVDMGFYHATEEFGRRGRKVVDQTRDEGLWWAFTTKMTTSLAALGRGEEAEALYDDARASSINPLMHRQAAYATAMLYTRHHAPERRDHRRARAWINEAIMIANLLGAANGKGFPVVFQQNGLALIEMHLGNLSGALTLVTEGLARLDQELGADEHRLHRSVLLHNRAQVLSGLGRLSEALDDYDAVIASDPNYAEYHFDRGNLLHRMGRDDEALAAYANAMRLSPPFPEVYYNRADVFLGQGEVDGALADLNYVLDLEPTNVDAYVNRAGILASLGEQEALLDDLDAGLRLDPDNPHLLCLLGQVHAEAARPTEAEAAYVRALDRDPTLAAAWAGRAALSYDAGDLAAAVQCLDQALAHGDDAVLRYNRATAHRALGRYEQALADLDRAQELDPNDPDTLRERAECLALLDAVAAGR